MWVTRGGQRTLAVVPTAAHRRHPTMSWAQAGWRDVVRREPAADTPGMREQYVCHALFAPTKARWYLEPWRPAGTLAQVVAQRCNVKNG
ncbi:MAG: DUF2599 domain-containing protein [Austwickia sp.]|jgi:hypothetical protein|nr:DUF2599 domain-containing protein [Austwickia sp.]MBK8436070.1 DUF2599 domain-containing protein [Austwickia sp.]MBK9101750.1 DUF2599 domain-containing protein [Austwickia sp.]